MSTTPYASTRLTQFIDQRIGELHHKTQAEIAKEAGFRNANFITMLKTGSSKLALDRVPSLAKALDVDPAFLLRLAIEQSYGPEMLKLISTLLGAGVTDNERAWIAIIRDASSKRDPAPCVRSEAAVRVTVGCGCSGAAIYFLAASIRACSLATAAAWFRSAILRSPPRGSVSWVLLSKMGRSASGIETWAQKRPSFSVQWRRFPAMLIFPFWRLFWHQKWHQALEIKGLL